MKGKPAVSVPCNMAGCDSPASERLPVGYTFCGAHYDSLEDAFAEELSE